MIIECTECHTRFKLADDKVKAGGTKVRCSKCKHIFTVVPPAPEPEPPQAEEIDFGEFNMERLPEPVSEVTGPAAAEASTAGDWSGENDSADAQTAGRGQSTSLEFSAEDEEEVPQPTEFTFGAAAENDAGEPASSQERTEDFSFGEEQAAADDDRFSMDDETRPTAEDSEGGLGPSDDFAFGDEGEGLDTFAFGEPDETETADDGLNFEESDDFSFDTETSSGSVEFDFGDEQAGTDFSWETESEESGESGFGFEESDKPASEGDDFDFSGMTFGEDDPPQTAPVAGGERLTQPQPEPALLSIEEELIPRKATQVETTATSTEPRAMPMVKPPKRKSSLQGLLLFIAILLMALLGGAIYFYWQGGIPELTTWVDRLTGQTVSSQAKGHIRLEELNSYYVKNMEVGQILVVQGKAFNDFTEARSSLAVKGVLFNKAGKALLQQTVYCGNPLAQEALQDLPYAKIEESMNNPFGESLSNLNVAPGKALPFTIVFRNLPADIAEFTVEVVDSKPASKQ